MIEFFCTVGGYRTTKLNLFAGQHGPWYIDSILDDSHADLSGAVVVQIGSMILNGTVEPAYSGDFSLQRSLRIIAGGGGWGTQLKQKYYHDDTGVRGLTIANDAARECGETLGKFEVGKLTLPVDYCRRFGSGSLVLDRLMAAYGDLQWWVDQAGVTQCGTRPTPAADSSKYQIDTYSPLKRMAEISLDDPAVLWVGSVLSSDRLSEPQTIRDYHLHVDGDKCRVFAFTGGDASDSSRIGRAFDALLEQEASKRLFGKYRYRVHSMAPDGRVNLQAVRRICGLPDALPVSIRPGAAACWADMVQGAELLVEFIEGDNMQPIVTGFPGRGDPGFLPKSIEIGVGGSSKGAPAARMGDSGVAFLPPSAPIAGTMTIGGNPTPFVGIIDLSGPTPVLITTGSGLVNIGGGES